MMLTAVLVQSNDRGRILYDEPAGPRRCGTHIYTQGNHIIADKVYSAGIWIRNRIQLLARASAWIVEIQEHIFLLNPGHGQGQIQIVFPFYSVRHVDLQKRVCARMANYSGIGGNYFQKIPFPQRPEVQSSMQSLQSMSFMSIGKIHAYNTQYYKNQRDHFDN